MRRFTEIGGWWVAGQMVLLAALGSVWILWGRCWGWAATVGGASLVILGVALAAAGLVALRRHLSPYPEPRPDAALVEGGVYRYVRHPIYGGIVLGALGSSVIDGNLAGLGLSAALMGLFYGKSGFEERRLIARFPEYAEYRDRVRCRLLPGLC